MINGNVIPQTGIPIDAGFGGQSPVVPDGVIASQGAGVLPMPQAGAPLQGAGAMSPEMLAMIVQALGGGQGLPAGMPDGALPVLNQPLTDPVQGMPVDGGPLGMPLGAVG